ncbi:MAG: aminotransferase class III-fold pyridoxal phosphate-dependent enzyme [Tepidisphaerales bacterium]
MTPPPDERVYPSLDRLARVEEGDSNDTPARAAFRASHLGPDAQAMLDRDEAAFVHQSLSTPCLNVLTGCDGNHLIDLEGRRILDLHGNGVHVLGFAHPAVVQAVARQLARLPFCTRRYTNLPATELAERLTGLMPDVPGGWRVLLAPAGCLAVGTALKAARRITGRYKCVGFWGAFHGASLETISVGGERLFRDGMGPLLPGALHAHPWTRDRSVADAVDELDRLFRVEGEIGALLAEPVRWSTVTRPPDDYWQAVRALCDRHNAWLIFDEIGTGVGRTGRFCAFEHMPGVVPDAVVLGKALGGGVYPLAATLIQARHVTPRMTRDTALGHYTHEKSPLGAAAALATLETISSQRLMERAAVLGEWVVRRLRERLAERPEVLDVRGMGLLMAVELSDAGHAEAVMYRCLRRGLSFKVSAGRVLTLVAPLTLSDAEATFVVDTLVTTISEGRGATAGPCTSTR